MKTGVKLGAYIRLIVTHQVSGYYNSQQSNSVHNFIYKTSGTPLLFSLLNPSRSMEVTKQSATEVFDCKEKCDLCSDSFTKKQELLYHKFKKHNVLPPDGEVCPQCEHPCFSKRGLQLHTERWCSGAPPKKKQKLEEANAEELHTVTFKWSLCDSCMANLKSKNFTLSRDDRSWYRTIFLCNTCMRRNYPK